MSGWTDCKKEQNMNKQHINFYLGYLFHPLRIDDDDDDCSELVGCFVVLVREGLDVW